MTEPRYKNRSMQELYVVLLALAEDRESELYIHGEQRPGAIHRNAFWDGYNGLKSLNNAPGRLVGAAYQAGKEFARRQARERKAHPGDPRFAKLKPLQVRAIGMDRTE